VVIGADAVYADGSVAHKVGTRELARAAFRRGVPVIVVAGRSKFTDGPPPRRPLPILFDRTPSRYITRFWTDFGVRAGRRPARRGSGPSSH
jgi:translation initiation factor 2B subunit (eIF-2B alpha/beta/delta family)